MEGEIGEASGDEGRTEGKTEDGSRGQKEVRGDGSGGREEVDGAVGATKGRGSKGGAKGASFSGRQDEEEQSPKKD